MDMAHTKLIVCRYGCTAECVNFNPVILTMCGPFNSAEYGQTGINTMDATVSEQWHGVRHAEKTHSPLPCSIYAIDIYAAFYSFTAAVFSCNSRLAAYYDRLEAVHQQAM